MPIPMRFVVWAGPDYPKDPLDKGCEAFTDAANVQRLDGFVKTLLNKGCRVWVYNGEHIWYEGCVNPF